MLHCTQSVLGVPNNSTLAESCLDYNKTELNSQPEKAGLSFDPKGCLQTPDKQKSVCNLPFSHYILLSTRML